MALTPQESNRTGLTQEILGGINQLLVSEMSLADGQAGICQFFGNDLGCTLVLLYEYNKAAENLTLVSHFNLTPRLLKSVSMFYTHRNEGGILNSCLISRDILISQNVEEAPICLEFMEEISSKQLHQAIIFPLGTGTDPQFLLACYYDSNLPAMFRNPAAADYLKTQLSVQISRLQLKERVEILEKQVNVDRKIISQKSTDIQKKGEQLGNIDTKLRRVVEVMLSRYTDQQTMMLNIFKVVSDLLNIETIGMGRSSGDFLVLEYIYDRENILVPGDQFPSLDQLKVTVKGSDQKQNMDMKNPFTMRKYVNHPVYQHLGFSTFFSTPIIIRHEPYGVLFAASKQVMTISTFEEDMLYFLAHKISFEIEKRQMEEQIFMHSQDLERTNQELQTINLLGQAITSVLDQESLLKTILKSLVEATKCEDASLFLYDEETDELVIKMVASEEHKSIEGFRMPSTKGIAGWVFSNKRSQIVNNTKKDERHDRSVDDMLKHVTESILCAPLVAPDSAGIGVVQLINKISKEGYNERDRAYLEMLTPFISIALKNARLYTLEQETTRKAQQAQALKSEFLSNMSHELRTPLTSIIAYTDILLRDYETFNDRQKKSVDRIKMSSKHLLNLINDILDLSKIEAGMMTIHRTEVDLQSIIQAATSTFELQSQQKGIQLQVIPPADRLILMTDEIRVKQILINLVSNALKFTEEGGIFISFESREDFIYISVKDTGTGIPEDAKDIIFESFRQVDGSASRKAGGTGLGLSISQKLATLLGGRLELESEVGVGSTFSLVLPYERGFL